jgi:hypothetical protein
MRRALPLLFLCVGLVVATSPLWRQWLFPQAMTIDEVLSFRCG